ncbi:MFS transporter [Legionella waltersii]|uniref:Putative transport protein n=1 Tax=Legionella waltersii TaxID=66969 RepID=A0A0W1A1A2_9GAMM|nr:MFS transporter [Legionella waltersii]KTD75148.1 putative transport protein [Legionella waltersii]SNV04816.1 putative transport protein [Legionella waltersii]
MFSKKERTLLFANNLWYLSEGMLGPLFGIFCAKFQSSPLDISWVWALYLISVGVVVIGLGYLSDFIYKEKLLVLGYALQTIFTFCYILVSNKHQLALLQVGLGISGGLSTTTWYALYARYEDKTHEGLTWGLANGLSSIYTGIALLCGGLVIANFSFEVLFTIMGCIQFIATIYVSKLVFFAHPKTINRLNETNKKDNDKSINILAN